MKFFFRKLYKEWS